MYVYVWVYRFFLSVQAYCIMTLDVCTSEYLQSVLHQSILILPRFVTQLPCVSWGDTLRRWDDRNGPTFLSLHRGGGYTLSAKYFWRHYLIISILIDFWALASPTLCHVCATAVCVSCVCHYCIPIWNTIKGCGEKWLGLSYSNECSDQSLQFAFHPRSHFIWKNIRRKPHIGLHRFTKQFKVLHRLRGRQWNVTS